MTPMIVVVVLTNSIPASEFGLYRELMVILPFLMLATLPGMDTVVTRYSMTRKPLDVMQVLVIKASSSVFFLMLAYLGINYSSMLDDEVYLALLPFVPFLDVLFFLKNRWFGRGRSVLAQRFLLFWGIYKFVACSVALIGCVIFDLDIVLMIPVMFVGGFFYGLNLLIRKYSAVSRRWSLKDCLPVARSAAAYTLFGCFSLALLSFDRLFVSTRYSAEDFAKYSILILFPLEFARLFDGLIPNFFEQLKKFGRMSGSSVAKWGAGLVVVCFFVGVAYCLAFHTLSPFVFGPVYNYTLSEVVLSFIFLLGLSVEFTALQVLQVFARPVYLFIYCFTGIGAYLLIADIARVEFNSVYILGAIVLRQVLWSGITICLWRRYEESVARN